MCLFFAAVQSVFRRNSHLLLGPITVLSNFPSLAMLNSSHS